MTHRDIRQHIGQLVIAGFDGHVVPADLKALVREFDLAGVIFFARNVDAPEQVLELSREVSSLARELPMWVSVDQEGGRVARLRTPFTEWPPLATLGRAGSDELAVRFARALATEVKAVGINLDYAPVLDVLTNAANTVIGDRALSDRAVDVARLGRLIISGLQGEGVAACGKHFPGHGDTRADSHDELPIVEHPPERLRDVEVVPFRAAIDEGVAAIMTAHVLVPAVDPASPATLSRAIVQGWLRDELRFDGLIVSDDLGMRALSDRYSAADAAIGAIDAGCDTVLLCGPDVVRHTAVLEALIRAAERDPITMRRVEDAMARQRRSKERFLPWPTPSVTSEMLHLVGCAGHQAIADEMTRYL